MLRCFITILLLAGLCRTACAGIVVGRVQNLAPRSSANPINRYAGREASGQSSSDTESLSSAAVVYLIGNSKTNTAPPTEHPKMVQKDQSFYPEVLPILVGTTVDFPNLDPVFHNVFSYSKAKKFDLGRYPKGHSKSVTFDSPGLVKVFCEIHSSMRAHILVLEQPYFATTASDGSFRITDVPAGEYVLKVWQEQSPETELRVTVPAADSVIVNVD
jgi:plastocyanin